MKLYKCNSQQNNKTNRKRIGNDEELSANIKGMKKYLYYLLENT